jgi:hypothetical protein
MTPHLTYLGVFRKAYEKYERYEVGTRDVKRLDDITRRWLNDRIRA